MEHNVYVERDIWRERAEKAEMERDAYLKMLTPAFDTGGGTLFRAATGHLSQEGRMVTVGPYANRDDAKAEARHWAGLDPED
jgi:NADPH:quinone reductase-like Zn-dependent oxidoreductase